MQRKIRKEYMFYDFLEHAFNIKYLLNEYEEINNRIIIKLSFTEFLNYYNTVVDFLLKDDVIVDFINQNNLLKHLIGYSIYYVNKEADDFYVCTEQYSPYHHINYGNLSIKEKLAFYNEEAQAQLVCKQALIRKKTC